MSEGCVICAVVFPEKRRRPAVGGLIRTEGLTMIAPLCEVHTATVEEFIDKQVADIGRVHFNLEVIRQHGKGATWQVVVTPPPEGATDGD